MKKNKEELVEISKQIRKDIVQMLTESASGHPGGSLSATDIVTTLFFSELNIDPNNPKDENRDRFVLSKGHAAPVLYSALARRGFFDPKELLTLRKTGSRLQGHPNMNDLPGIDMSTGSLGQGISAAVGMALAGKADNKSYRVYALLGDGELEEGQVWEASMCAAHYKLDNLTAFVDFNGLQISGKVSDVMDFTPIGDKFREFGWAVREIDGNNMDEIVEAFDALPFEEGKPSMIVAHTVKAKGLKEGEGKASYHYWNPSKEDCDALEKDLMEQLRGYEDEI